MTRQSIVRMTSAGFLLGGPFVAAWTLVSPWGSFAGAERGGSVQWVIAHSCHYLAALCLLFGVLGLAVQRLPTAGRWETLAQLYFLFAMWVYGGTGAITSRVWPLISHHAGAIVEPEGAMFKPYPEFLQTLAVPVLAIAVAALLHAMWRARILPLAALVTGAAGAAMFFVPTAPLSPLPWIFFPAAGTLSGLGLAWLGWSLRGGAAPSLAEVPPHARAAREPAAV
jgi:hypothetical protein